MLFGFVGGTPIPLELQLLALPVIALLVAISVYDIRLSIIPDAWVYSFCRIFASFFARIPDGDARALEGFTPLFLAGPALRAAVRGAVVRFRWQGNGPWRRKISVGHRVAARPALYAFVAIVSAFVLGALVSVLHSCSRFSPQFRKFLSRLTHTRALFELGVGGLQ